jgi:hypothetical protein
VQGSKPFDELPSYLESEIEFLASRLPAFEELDLFTACWHEKLPGEDGNNHR